MEVVVPFSGERPKTRLSPVLEPAERERFARAMLADVLEAVVAAGGEPTVLATGPLELTSLAIERPEAVRTRVDDRPLTEAINAVLEERAGATIAIVMADLALATPAALEALFTTDGDVVIAPGRGCGTNALVVRHPAFRVDYHGTSYLDHRRAARAAGATVKTVDSFRLATDVDEPADLAEVLVHTDGRARAVLEDAGFDLVVRDGRVDVER